MEVYIADVGQGASQIILLGGNRAIVVDCGTRSGVLLQLLEKLRVERLERLILSHNHDDHVGGAVAVMTAYERKIGELWFLEDGALLSTKFWTKVHGQLKEGKLRSDQLRRLECDGRPYLVFGDAARGVELKLLSPEFGENLQAIVGGNPNAASGVLVLTVESGRIVFPSDSTVDQWRRIRAMLGRPLDCDVLVVPHHAGIVGDDRELDWLYTEGVRPRVGVVSVSTNNRHGHPRVDVLKRLRAAKASVVCTQITPKCCQELEAIRPGVLSPVLPGRSKSSRDQTKEGRSLNVACGGTLLAELRNGRFVIARRDEHRDAVVRLSERPGASPLCL